MADDKPPAKDDGYKAIEPPYTYFDDARPRPMCPKCFRMLFVVEKGSELIVVLRRRP